MRQSTLMTIRVVEYTRAGAASPLSNRFEMNAGSTPGTLFGVPVTVDKECESDLEDGEVEILSVPLPTLTPRSPYRPVVEGPARNVKLRNLSTEEMNARRDSQE